ncbi:hypothetical protein ACFY41_20390 [Streptomyces syringium]|uniref:hypothetical protein n=1 Tax=Streptomyces syringium TaxID=76729 RepID=UPI0036AEB339
MAWKTRRRPDAVPCTRNRPSSVATRWKLPGKRRASESSSVRSRMRAACRSSSAGRAGQQPTTAIAARPARAVTISWSLHRPISQGRPEA